MSPDLLIITLSARYLRSNLKTAEKHPQWNRRLLLIMYGTLALYVVTVLFDTWEEFFIWVGLLSLAAFAYLLYTQPVFRPARPILIALMPYTIISIFVEFVKTFDNQLYHKWNNYLDAAQLFAIVWGIGTWVFVNKQNKELNKVREKASQEEENSRIANVIKLQLEVQVAERTAELTKQKEELEQTLEELKATQTQLIQSEKMASLGELTAGIAHEIQNPLNFVNNFSEVSQELLDEMKTEIIAGNNEEVLAITGDIRQNLEKIIHHGKRADAIVKGMLQHSRKSTGQKEVINLNALCDEFLRLSYHGLRAKDKSFNAGFKTCFDETIDKVNVVPQDVGRVLLNLCNNAFYAVNEKKKISDEQRINYQPLVSISTKRVTDADGDGCVEIDVQDNGNGIAEAHVKRIFQPFFTTKPAGQGTGLGLSLSYDIITKQHNGTIEVKTKEGEGTLFSIQLPCK